MKLRAPRLVREFGFSEPEFNWDSYEAHTTLRHPKGTLKLIKDGPLWVYFEFADGSERRVELSPLVEGSIGRALNSEEVGITPQPLASLILLWDDLLPNYFARVEQNSGYTKKWPDLI